MSQLDVHDIEKVIFGILSAEEIKSMAVCKLDSTKLSGPGSVYDERMGCVTDNNEKCVTCKLKKECWGHFGYIELVEPILHPLYFKTITAFLKCFCKQCHRLLMTEDQIHLAGLSRFKHERRFVKILERLEKVDICAYCSSPQPKIIHKSKDATISMEYKQKHKKGADKKGNEKVSIILNVEEIKKVLDNIVDSDVVLIGFDPARIHPRNLIMTIFPVIPPCARPYVVADGNICDDDLTYQTLEIIKINNQLMKDDLSEQKRQKLIQSLKFRISTTYNNSKGKAKHPTDSRPIKGIKERLASKQGQIRTNHMGKRVDYSARTVIGAEPTLKLDELGIPLEIAAIHTKPEPVTEYNIEWLTQLINDGKVNFVITNGGKTRVNLRYAMFRRGTELLHGDIIVRGDVRLCEDDNGEIIIPPEHKGEILEVVNGNQTLQEGDRLIRNKCLVEAKYPSKKRFNLRIGDVVERQLQRGDIVLFNRQPTLHKGSMLAKKVVPMPYKTFRMNLAATKSFNADFDGDEMNLHAPQSYEAEAELRSLSATPHNMISAQESKPGVVIVQDALLGAWKMTKENKKITRSQFMKISLKGERVDGSPLWNPEKIRDIKNVLKKFRKKPTVFSGRGLISLILPNDLYYECKNNAMDEEPTVKIYAGVMYEGALDKKNLSSSHKSLILILHKEYGSKVAANFVDNIQFIVNNWLLISGFSVGLEDCMITSEESVMTIKDTLTQCYIKAQGIEETTYNPGIREVRVTAALSQAKDVGMRIARDAMSKSNNFLSTVRSGAKGDFFNIAQLTGLLGQQNLFGCRVVPVLNHGKRTLPHYPFGKLSKEREYESRGFIRHSFIHGLTPEEFYFHAMSGREGICDTAMGTADSGYIQRRIVKVCEDIQVQYDGTVRDATGKIYQLAYGEDGYDATQTVRVGGVPQICDISRLAQRLNNEYERDMEDPERKGRRVSAKKNKKELAQKKALIKKIKARQSNTTVDEKWPVEQLQIRLEAFNEPSFPKKITIVENSDSDSEESDSEEESESEEEEEVNEPPSDSEEESEEEVNEPPSDSDSETEEVDVKVVKVVHGSNDEVDSDDSDSDASDSE
jgi:DNA-directed RNA polymerase beta' subunit